MRLTDGQLTALRVASKADGASKANIDSRLWRNLDQLERRELVTRIGFSQFYHTTETGLAELKSAGAMRKR